VAMAEAPVHIDLKRHRDLEGRRNEIWARRGLLTLVLLLPLAASFNVFGQRPQTTTASTGAASLEAYSPARIRPGDVFESRFTITARRELKQAALRLHPGWLESMSINSIVPQPSRETSDGEGRAVLTLGRIEAGDRYRLFIYFQVNPTNVGRRPQDVDLLDGDRVVAHIDRVVTIFP
jgi:hypothetical protein